MTKTTVRRVTTIAGEKVHYTYNKANRQVVILVKWLPFPDNMFTATSWENAPAEVADALGH